MIKMSSPDTAGSSTTSRTAEEGENIADGKDKWKKIEKTIESKRWIDNPEKMKTETDVIAKF